MFLYSSVFLRRPQKVDKISLCKCSGVVRVSAMGAIPPLLGGHGCFMYSVDSIKHTVLLKVLLLKKSSKNLY